MVTGTTLLQKGTVGKYGFSSGKCTCEGCLQDQWSTRQRHASGWVPACRRTYWSALPSRCFLSRDGSSSCVLGGYGFREFGLQDFCINTMTATYIVVWLLQRRGSIGRSTSTRSGQRYAQMRQHYAVLNQSTSWSRDAWWAKFWWKDRRREIERNAAFNRSRSWVAAFPGRHLWFSWAIITWICNMNESASAARWSIHMSW